MPALTKNAGESLWGRGFAYLADFVDPYFLWLPLVVTTVLLVGLFRRLRARRDLVVAFAPVVAGALHLVYVIKVGGTTCTPACCCPPCSSFSCRFS
jgi:arabinofuranosyltransferase